jgi:uncharacterized protein involved in response to NO
MPSGESGRTALFPSSTPGAFIAHQAPLIARRRLQYEGPAVFSYGFRPFFLAGALWAVVGVLLWMPQYFGELSLPNVLSPLEWHIHEMIYGYMAAVVAGFLLTAIPNWTGRLPVNQPNQQHARSVLSPWLPVRQHSLCPGRGRRHG